MCRRRDWSRGSAVAAAALAWLTAAPVAAQEAAASAQDSAANTTSVVRAAGGPPQPVSVALDGDSVRQFPGSGGDPTVAAQNLPGVARSAPGATGLVIWGATPAESRVLFDDIQIPVLYHLGGFRSTVGAELVGRIELVPGAYGAEYGRALGGIVRVDSRVSRHDDTDGTHLVLDANLLDTTASLRASVLDNLRVAVAARASYLGTTYGRLAPSDATALFPIPRYADAQVEAVLDVGPSATLRAVVLTSSDRAQRNLVAHATGLPERREDQERRWWRAGLAYAQHGDDDGLIATVFVGGQRDTLAQRFGAVPAGHAISTFTLGLRARYRARLDNGLRLTIGLDGLAERSRIQRTGSLSIPAREGDRTIFGQPPGDDVNADTWTATVGDVGPFIATSLTRGAWTFRPGVRADAFPVDGSRALPPVGATPLIGYAHLDWALDPRLSVAYEASPPLMLTAAVGLYHQPVDATDLSAVFGAPGLKPTRAIHATLSARQRLTETTRVELTGFYRRLDDLAVRSPLAAPLLAQALTPTGQGRSFGLNVQLQHQPMNGTLAWVTYTLSRADRSVADARSRLFDFDQTHVVTAIVRRPWRAWTFGGRARYATGMPRTPVVGSFLDLRDGTYQPLFGAQNSTRLPPFFQVDARIDRTFVAGPTSVVIYLDVQNLTAHRNAEEVVYARDYSSSGFLTGPPLLVLLGVRITS